ncbi:MAG: DUF2007 domain-containing protein [Leeuwenhoekiella sp.]
MKNYILLLTNSGIIVDRAAALLAEKNITTHIKNHVESARMAGFGVSHNDIELFVPEAHLADAQ